MLNFFGIKLSRAKAELLKEKCFFASGALVEVIHEGREFSDAARKRFYDQTKGTFS
jgi:hypothetical protein